MSFENFSYEQSSYRTSSAQELIPMLIDKFNPTSVLDVGCGNGSWLSAVKDAGITDYMGIDGRHISEDKLLFPLEKFRAVDIAAGFNLHRTFDLCLCLEVAEHLDSSQAEKFIESLVKHSELIVFSAAVPGQGGDLHKNEREPSYWQDLFSKFGFSSLDTIRPEIWNNENINWWYRQNIFVASKAGFEGLPHKKINFLIHPELYYRKKNIVNYYDHLTISKLPRLILRAIKNSISGVSIHV